jgi:hypothetical protein
MAFFRPPLPYFPRPFGKWFAEHAPKRSIGGLSIIIGFFVSALPSAEPLSLAQAEQTPTYKVMYNANADNFTGKVPTDNLTYEQGTTVTVQPNAGNLKRQDFAFTGWNTRVDGGGTHYDYIPPATFTMGNSDVVLYAEWTSTDIAMSPTAQIISGTIFTLFLVFICIVIIWDCFVTKKRDVNGFEA